VHNGINANPVALRRELEGEGVHFSSDTDTEIVAHLVDRAIRRGVSDLFEAVRKALSEVRGAYAIAVVSRGAPDRLVVAKSASPLVIGVGDGETLCGSDIPALLAHTRQMIFLEDGEMAELKASGVRLETIAPKTVVNRAPKRIDWSPMMAERGGYKHFMLKEIHEQPRSIEDTLRGRIELRTGDVNGSEIGLSEETLRSVRRVYFIACGTSHHATIAGRYWMEQFGRVPSVTELASEVRYREPIFGPDDLVVAVSQSGETADTLAAVKSAKAGGARVLAVVNVLDSAIARAADGALYTHAGPEIGVASTKCFTAQLAAMLLLSVHFGRVRGALDQERGRAILQALVESPAAVRSALEQGSAIFEVARRYQGARDVLFLGRGLGYPIALEGALKLKEISYIHADGYAAGEMKHGPIALIDRDMPVVAVAPIDSQYEKMFSNIEEVRAREGQIIAIASEGDHEIKRVAQHIIRIPKVDDAVLPIVSVIPLQLLAYFIADLKGTDVDQPRNLAKTVTVE
jgi:glucosamine--fructose-6-phosphate aminotransferase (isomerizing)